MHPIYQVNLKLHKQELKKSSRKMMWQHRASKSTHGQVRLFRLKHSLKITPVTAHSQMAADQEMKRSELKQSLILQPLRLQKRLPLALASNGHTLVTAHATSLCLSAYLCDSSQNSQGRPFVCPGILHRQQHDTPNGQERTSQTESQFHHTL